MAFKHGSGDGYVVSAASNIVVKVATDPTSGAATVLSDPLDTTRVLQIPTGSNPRGIVVDDTDTRAYVMNYISRDVTVIDLTGPRESVLATVRSAARPLPGTLQDKIHIGKELYTRRLVSSIPLRPAVRRSSDGCRLPAGARGRRVTRMA
jgi:DNA-binding beta-propeller fold protein YncE